MKSVPGNGEEILRMAQKQKARCFACFLTVMEIFYRVWKDEGEQEGRLVYQQCQTLPIEWIYESSQLLETAAEHKATHSVFLADTWIAACATLNDCFLVHKDPEFEALNCEQLRLAYKTAGFEKS